MIDENTKEILRTRTVEILLVLRTAYLRTGQANMLKHWQILQSRMRAASRTTASPEEWATKMARDLQIPNLSSSGCQVLADLTHAITERGCRSEWLDLLDAEAGYIMALTRLASEKQGETRCS